ncbi:hypothetical protein [Brevibacterium litoralis]|uniref:hypothetical protein n=1 Tax=Brevibacterium litoralis TaxID=3138935 RepID=UPI0032ECAF27
MEEFPIGATVQVTGETMKDQVGTVVYHYEEKQQYLVRIGTAQLYYTADELKLFKP